MCANLVSLDPSQQKLFPRLEATSRRSVGSKVLVDVDRALCLIHMSRVRLRPTKHVEDVGRSITAEGGRG